MEKKKWRWWWSSSACKRVCVRVCITMGYKISNIDQIYRTEASISTCGCQLRVSYECPAAKRVFNYYTLKSDRNCSVAGTTMIIWRAPPLLLNSPSRSHSPGDGDEEFLLGSLPVKMPDKKPFKKDSWLVGRSVSRPQQHNHHRVNHTAQTVASRWIHWRNFRSLTLIIRRPTGEPERSAAHKKKALLQVKRWVRRVCATAVIHFSK